MIRALRVNQKKLNVNKMLRKSKSIKTILEKTDYVITAPQFPMHKDCIEGNHCLNEEESELLYDIEGVLSPKIITTCLNCKFCGMKIAREYIIEEDISENPFDFEALNKEAIELIREENDENYVLYIFGEYRDLFDSESVSK